VGIMVGIALGSIVGVYYARVMREMREMRI